jgi:hypothetical protein
MDGDLPFAERISATVVHDGTKDDIDLPLWVDRNGRLQIALPRPASLLGSDQDQIIAALLRAAGGALECHTSQPPVSRPARRR